MKNFLYFRFSQFNILLIAIAISILFQSNSYAERPIGWSGTFGIDSTHIDTWARSERNVSPAVGSTGTTSTDGKEQDANIQSYLFSLRPTILVNDSVSIKGEMNTGYARSGFLGDSSTRTGADSTGFGNALYFQNTTAANDNTDIHLTKLYMELYSDTGTYIIGRHPLDWGLGLLWNSGDKIWDRHTTVQDGVLAKFKIGNFNISPFWAKVSSVDTLTSEDDVKSFGISFLYDNIESDLALGLVYAKKSSETYNETMQSDSTNSKLGSSDVKLIDLYFKKHFYSFQIASEIIFLSGDIGAVYNVGDLERYKANAIIVESSYELNDRWQFGIDLGQATGDDGETSSFKAMYLHPNYHIANLMFRYNYLAIADASKNFFDAYITNAKFVKVYTQFLTENWNWKASLIWAKANEVPKGTTGTPVSAFDHMRNQKYTATKTQDEDYGYEIDLDFDYFWNRNVTVTGNFGYHFVGDYFKFTNSNTGTRETKNTYIGSLKVAVAF